MIREYVEIEPKANFDTLIILSPYRNWTDSRQSRPTRVITYCANIMTTVWIARLAASNDLCDIYRNSNCLKFWVLRSIPGTVKQKWEDSKNEELLYIMNSTVYMYNMNIN